MPFSLFNLTNNDNEIEKIYRVHLEYTIEINLWDGRICKLRTVNCKKIIHNIESVDEFGDIIVENNIYKFMTVDGEEIILQIEADDILIDEIQYSL